MNPIEFVTKLIEHRATKHRGPEVFYFTGDPTPHATWYCPACGTPLVRMDN